jgi:preprotein translocase subunit SecA
MPEIPTPKREPIRERVEAATTNSGQAEQRPEPIRAAVKVGRNQPCPCGSGRNINNAVAKTDEPVTAPALVP